MTPGNLLQSWMIDRLTEGDIPEIAGWITGLYPAREIDPIQFIEQLQDEYEDARGNPDYYYLVGIRDSRRLFFSSGKLITPNPKHEAEARVCLVNLFTHPSIAYDLPACADCWDQLLEYLFLHPIDIVQTYASGLDLHQMHVLKQVGFKRSGNLPLFHPGQNLLSCLRR